MKTYWRQRSYLCGGQDGAPRQRLWKKHRSEAQRPTAWLLWRYSLITVLVTWRFFKLCLWEKEELKQEGERKGFKLRVILQEHTYEDLNLLQYKRLTVSTVSDIKIHPHIIPMKTSFTSYTLFCPWCDHDESSFTYVKNIKTAYVMAHHFTKSLPGNN